MTQGIHARGAQNKMSRTMAITPACFMPSHLQQPACRFGITPGVCHSLKQLEGICSSLFAGLASRQVSQRCHSLSLVEEVLQQSKHHFPNITRLLSC